MKPLSPAGKHLLATVLSFAVALVVDLSGHLSPQGHTLAITLIGALGLSTAAAAFRTRQDSAPAVEQALVGLVAEHLPALLRHAEDELSTARVAFQRYLDRNFDAGATRDVTGQETPEAKRGAAS
jgi:hypothetical protein